MRPSKSHYTVFLSLELYSDFNCQLIICVLALPITETITEAVVFKTMLINYIT